jgi:asparagine synthase (glutamine-hydrolysing)
MEDSATTEEFERERYEVEPPLPTREEVAYYRIFAEALDHVRPKSKDTIGRFATA